MAEGNDISSRGDVPSDVVPRNAVHRHPAGHRGKPGGEGAPRRRHRFDKTLAAVSRGIGFPQSADAVESPPAQIREAAPWPSATADAADVDGWSDDEGRDAHGLAQRLQTRTQNETSRRKGARTLRTRETRGGLGREHADGRLSSLGLPLNRTEVACDAAVCRRRLHCGRAVVQCTLRSSSCARRCCDGIVSLDRRGSTDIGAHAMRTLSDGEASFAVGRARDYDTLIGTFFAPRRLMRPFQVTGPASASFGKRFTRRLIATRPSSRASAEPRQWCAPRLKDT
jgi:hypothetical protein